MKMDDIGACEIWVSHSGMLLKKLVLQHFPQY